MLRYYLTALVYLLMISPLYADGGQALFREAMQSFKAGNYTAAMASFERAEALGMTNPALYYNLGVVYYRLKQWEKAIAAFKKTAEYPKMAPLAYYNLGLVKRKQNDTVAARGWFERTLETTEDTKLKQLANHALETLPQKSTGWSTFLSIGLGYDDNVTLESDISSVASEESDIFYEFFGFTQGLLSGAYRDGILFRGSLFGDIYQEQSDYSLLEGNLGLYKRFPIQSWQSEGGIYATYSTLGGDPYLSSGNLVLDTRRDISEQLTLRFRLRFKSIHALDQESEGLEGTQYDLRSEGIWVVGGTGDRIRSYYQLELNDREDIETSTTFTSLSATRHSVMVDYRKALTPDWQFKTSGSYRWSRYDEENIDSAGIAQTRIDKRMNIAFELSRRHLWDNVQLALEYRYTDNDSNIDSYSYSRSMLMINLMNSF